MDVKKAQCKGWMLVEIIATIGIISIIMAGLAITAGSMRRFNSYHMVRQRCIAAGQAQLESIATTSQKIDAERWARLWPGVSAAVEETRGAGDWAGLELITVTTRGESMGKEVVVKLSRYITAGKEK